MKLNTNITALLLAAAGSLAAALPAAAAEPTGEAFAHTCAACHGTNGELEGEAFVPLAGMPRETIVRLMTEFRDLKRPSSIMSHIANGYSDAEIGRIADWFSSRKPSPNGTIPYAELGNFHAQNLSKTPAEGK